MGRTTFRRNMTREDWRRYWRRRRVDWAILAIGFIVAVVTVAFVAIARFLQG